MRHLGDSGKITGFFLSHKWPYMVRWLRNVSALKLCHSDASSSAVVPFASLSMAWSKNIIQCSS